ncbi:MAG: hypothetical protein HY735_06520 [Verrucomicrobia bacterium]|nr:hypothetical protein [Verrucomicrobiota bacterium]
MTGRISQGQRHPPYRPGEIEGGGGRKVTYADGTAPVVLRLPTEGGVVTELRPIFHAAIIDSQKNRVSTPLGFLRFGTPRRLSEEFAACWAQLGSHIGLELIELLPDFPAVAWR